MKDRVPAHTNGGWRRALDTQWHLLSPSSHSSAHENPSVIRGRGASYYGFDVQGGFTSNDCCMAHVQFPADHPEALPSPVSTTLYDINSSLGENPSVFVMTCGYNAPLLLDMELCPDIVLWLQLLNYCTWVMLTYKWTLLSTISWSHSR